MIKAKYVFGIVLCFLAVAVCSLNQSAQARQAGDRSTGRVDVGRDDPFGQLINKLRPSAPQTISETVSIEKPELFVDTVTLKFLNAESLKSAIETMSSEYGSVTTNQKTNSLIICDTKENLTKLLAEVRKADKTPPQIVIEVVILDVQLNNDTEIGINWDILSDKTYDIGYRQNFTAARLGSTIENAATIGDATAFNTTGLGGSFSVISGTIRHVVHLIQQKRQVEILADPKVMMVSGESASIEAVEELPYDEVVDTAAGGVGALTSTQFKRVGVHLDVSAILTDNNDILLTVDAEQNVATGQSTTNVPIIDTRRVNTSLLLKDGQIVILGGLRRQEKTKEVSQIPILADLPIIGGLFKSTNISVRNSELIVFLSPHIYKDEPISDEAMAKYKQIKDWSMLSDSKLKECRDQLEQRAKEQTAAIEQLQEKINESERVEEELQVHRERLEGRLSEQTGAKAQLQQDIAQCKQSADELRQYRYQLEQHIVGLSAANKQLRAQISEGKQEESELKEYRDQLEQRVEEHTGANEQLLHDITESQQAMDELKEYHHQLEQHIMEQSATNKQLQAQISEDKRVEGELKEYRTQLEQRAKEQTATVGQLQLEMTKRKQTDRDATKKMLLDRIRMLQNRRDDDATKELLLTLTSLDKILGQEIQEALSASEKVLADGGM